MTDRRLAVAPGRHAVRVAEATGARAPRLLATLPAHPGNPAALLAGLVGPTVEEVVLVYPPGRTAASVHAWLAAAHTVASRADARVRRVAAPIAALAGTGAHAVLDVGRTGAEATLVQAGRIVARRSSGVGGDRLDLAVRALLARASPDDARRVRETLSLLPEVRHGPARIDAAQLRAALIPLFDEAVAALAEVLAAAPEPVAVLLTGGVARTPLLAERVDAAALSPDVRVAPRPDLAAVLGALVVAPGAGPPGAGRERSGPDPPERAARSAPSSPAMLAPPPPARRARRWVGVAAAAVLVGGVAAGGTAVAVPLRQATPTVVEVPAGVLVQYGYRLDVPAGWEQSGGLPERRRSLLTRVTAPDGTDLIAVERTPLGYDAAAEPERAAAELRAAFDRSKAAGATLSGYRSTEVAGRPVTTYRQAERAGAVVDWFVVLDGDAQLSVGCRHTQVSTAAVQAACEVVVGSIRPA